MWLFVIVIALVASQGLDPKIPITEHIVTPQPYEYMKNEDLPKEYDPYLLLVSFHILVVISMAVPMFPLPRTNIFLNTVVLVGLSLLLQLFQIVFVL